MNEFDLNINDKAKLACFAVNALVTQFDNEVISKITSTYNLDDICLITLFNELTDTFNNFKIEKSNNQCTVTIYRNRDV